MVFELVKPKRNTPIMTYMENTLDPLFSRYIRLKASHQGYCRCVTCGVIDRWQDMDAGHYVGRGHMAIRYDERNVNVQCIPCNRFQEGNKPAYTLYLIAEYGEGIIDELEQLGRTIKQFKLYELKKLAKTLRVWVNELEAEKL